MANGKRYMNAAICNKITQVAYDTYYKDNKYSDFVKQNSNLKVCNVHPEGSALVGHIKDFDDFDYGTITIEPVEV